MPDKKRKYITPFRIFKPRKNGAGAASQWEFSMENKCMFVEFANQKDGDMNNTSFDWNQKSIMKLSIIDIGEILAVFLKMQNGIGLQDSEGKYKGLYHQNPKGNKILQLAKNTKRPGYYIRLSSKLQGDSKPKTFEHAITCGEAVILSTLLRRAIEVIHGWGWD
jgi:hypothetical protein